MNNTQLETIIQALNKRPLKNSRQILNIIRQEAGKFKQPPPPKSALLTAYKKLITKKQIKIQPALRQFLVKRAVRSLSGVSVITVLTKPFPCPGKCVYCPTELIMPKSYLSNEPAAQRALRNQFDPLKMMAARITALEANGHDVDKIELIVLGGTWSAYDKKYQTWFITSCFFAANTYGKKKKRKMKSLIEEQKINETAKYKIIGLTLETRPDHINKNEVKRLRQLGCTRVQLGVQHTDDKILDYIKRGDTLQNAIDATRLLKEAGFKVDHHYMPDLPGSTPAKDLAMFKYVFSQPDLQPDQIKIYPTVVNEFAELYNWYKTGKHKPYKEKVLLKLLLDIKKIIPPYVRINRLIRDIPKESITAGNNITNLRQYLQQEAKIQGWSCQCIHCREVRNTAKTTDKIELVKRTYRASEGTEIFISFESPDRKKLYAFLRLRFNDQSEKNIFPELRGASLVRELHVYGQMIPALKLSDLDTKTQHRGLGSKLMAEAEKMTKENGLKKAAVISGIGVKNYYRKLGYKQIGTYMLKNL
ncbi:MAG: tRNA uridine(34) 5-carboxymethylaminomethyl modification radical SAM/GNAT enzyme Elp3 [Candidatus Buchananbacteria bacterium]|nr:tRNA uridine(34) 5-carboxymethylaminomethyl modification radical SAM/GNAT enzyme Elp3 [Candidatus Buchananbacteria bacterium]